VAGQKGGTETDAAGGVNISNLREKGGGHWTGPTLILLLDNEA